MRLATCVKIRFRRYGTFYLSSKSGHASSAKLGHLNSALTIAARQEYINDISPKQEIENIPKNEEIQQEKESQKFTQSF